MGSKSKFHIAHDVDQALRHVDSLGIILVDVHMNVQCKATVASYDTLFHFDSLYCELW